MNTQDADVVRYLEQRRQAEQAHHKARQGVKGLLALGVIAVWIISSLALSIGTGILVTLAAVVSAALLLGVYDVRHR